MSSPVALVTGVSSGIGNATARMLIERGYRVFGTARSESSPMPAKVERVLLDVRDAASIDAGVREVLAKAGRIDLLVNNAGGGMVGAIEETSLEQAQRLFDVNFFGAVRMTQAVLPTMGAQRSGRIVFISSIVGFLPAPFMGFYAASKHALEGLARPRSRACATRWASAPVCWRTCADTCRRASSTARSASSSGSIRREVPARRSREGTARPGPNGALLRTGRPTQLSRARGSVPPPGRG